jgi:predicted metal-dependent hydrolase
MRITHTAPRWVTITAVEEAIIAKQRWILNKITEQKPAATSARNAAVE